MATYLDSWLKEKNFSKAEHYFLGLFNGKIRYRILFKFDLMDLPKDCEIVDATLNILCSRNDSIDQEKFYEVHPAIHDWSAQTATWTSQPHGEFTKQINGNYV